MTGTLIGKFRLVAPAVALACLVEVGLWLSGVTVGTSLRYAAYLTWGVLLPGTLVHRALRGRAVRLTEDLAAGLVVGLGLELVVFIVLGLLDLRWLLPWWPLAVVVPMLAVPRLRRCWRWGGAPGWTTGQAWALAGVLAAVFAWIAQDEWLRHPISPGVSWYPRPDSPFHLAIASELRHHMPPTASWVLGQPLDYHWFAHAHLASASMVSGVELRVLLMRFYLLPLIAAAAVLLAVLATRLSGKGWAGPAAAGLAFAVGDLSPFRWAPAVFLEGGPLGITLWYSPTQTFATPVLALTVVLLTDLLRDRRRQLGVWALLLLAVFVLAGAKATFLPVLGGGLGVAFAVQLLRRRFDRVLFAAGLTTVAAAALAVVVLFQGQTQGLALNPFGGVDSSVGGRMMVGVDPDPSTTMIVLVTAVTLLSWTVRLAAGALVLRRNWADPVVGVLTGCLVTGIAGSLLTDQPGGSQLYFVRAAFPLGAVLAAWGLALVLARIGSPRRTAVYAASALVLGVLAATAAVLWVPSAEVRPTVSGGSRAALVAVLLPLAAVLALCAAGAVLFALLPGVRSRGRAGVAVFLVAVGAAGLLRLGLDGIGGVEWAQTRGRASKPIDSHSFGVTPASLAAARWLRAHSSPDDVVATNVHCRRSVGSCDNRQFWVAAFSERRVLVEGWGFTSRSNAEYLAAPGRYRSYTVPYWDQARLHASDAAFTDPTPAALAELRDRWGVRWLFVHRRGGATVSPRLGGLAELRFSTRDAQVYELRGQ